MADGQRPGGLWDWPVGVIVGAALLALLAAGNGAAGGVLLALLVGTFGVVALLVRRGAFTPRR